MTDKGKRTTYSYEQENSYSNSGFPDQMSRNTFFRSRVLHTDTAHIDPKCHEIEYINLVRQLHGYQPPIINQGEQ